MKDGGQAPAIFLPSQARPPPRPSGGPVWMPRGDPARPLLTQSPTHSLSIICVTAFQMSLFLPKTYAPEDSDGVCGAPGPW